MAFNKNNKCPPVEDNPYRRRSYSEWATSIDCRRAAAAAQTGSDGLYDCSLACTARRFNWFYKLMEHIICEKRFRAEIRFQVLRRQVIMTRRYTQLFFVLSENCYLKYNLRLKLRVSFYNNRVWKPCGVFSSHTLIEKFVITCYRHNECTKILFKIRHHYIIIG